MTNVVIADPGYLVRKGFKTIIEETEYISLIGEITYNINQGINMKTLNFLKTILIGYIILSFSYTNAQDKVGVLVLAHGGSTTWNEIVLQQLNRLKIITMLKLLSEWLIRKQCRKELISLKHKV
ncbi:MAG: hypothetical protein IIC75_06620 [Bacteroidetes bacterium]|nr:hypothetical protein [Bacteroidota bacterium]